MSAEIDGYDTRSANIYHQGKDHKDIHYQGKKHCQMYFGSQLVWEIPYMEVILGWITPNGQSTYNYLIPSIRYRDENGILQSVSMDPAFSQKEIIYNGKVLVSWENLARRLTTEVTYQGPQQACFHKEVSDVEYFYRVFWEGGSIDERTRYYNSDATVTIKMRGEILHQIKIEDADFLTTTTNTYWQIFKYNRGIITPINKFTAGPWEDN